jgi:hypothetical protein
VGGEPQKLISLLKVNLSRIFSSVSPDKDRSSKLKPFQRSHQIRLGINKIIKNFSGVINIAEIYCLPNVLADTKTYTRWFKRVNQILVVGLMDEKTQVLKILCPVKGEKAFLKLLRHVAGFLKI